MKNLIAYRVKAILFAMMVAVMSCVGPEGPQGPVGPNGDKGETGLQGQAGQQGPGGSTNVIYKSLDINKLDSTPK